ncbi:MAG: helix-turn-helix transcriptional regulator [Methylomonas sp.]
MVIHLNECKLTENQQITPLDDGNSLFTATVNDTGQLRWWLLGFADQIEVLKPKSLREEFKVKAQTMARKYAD